MQVQVAPRGAPVCVGSQWIDCDSQSVPGYVRALLSVRCEVSSVVPPFIFVASS